MADVYLYTHTKRRRLTRSLRKIEVEIESTVHKVRLKIFELPRDALHFIFNWLSCKFLATNVKILSKYFQEQVNEYLYHKFLKMSPKLSELYTKASGVFETSQNKDLTRKMFHILTYTETMILECRILEASISRFLFQRKSDFIFCQCFARILDIYDYLYYKLNNKKRRYHPNSTLRRDLKKFCKTSRSFICHFERHTEKYLNTNCYVSGAKICDILEAGSYCERKILEENYHNDSCCLKIRYTLPNAWFIVLPILSSEHEQKSWSEQQKLMYLRLRRLITSYTNQQMVLKHWRLAQKLRDLGIIYQPVINNYVYNGYGEFNEELYFYGSFNPGGYTYKVRKMEHREPSKDEKSPYNLQIDLELTSPLEQAPLFIYKKHCLHIDQKQERLILKRRSPRLNSVFRMRITFSSVPAVGVFLPSKYLFEVSEEERLNIVEKRAKMFI